MNPDKMSSNSQHVDIEHDSHPQDEILREDIIHNMLLNQLL